MSTPQTDSNQHQTSPSPAGSIPVDSRRITRRHGRAEDLTAWLYNLRHHAPVQATLDKVASLPGVRITLLGHPIPSPASPLRDDVVEAVTAAVQARYPGTKVIPMMAPYGTDGLQTRSAGIPTYGVMGIFVKDSDNFAHGLNERVRVRDCFGAQEYWKTVLTRVAGRQ